MSYAGIVEGAIDYVGEPLTLRKKISGTLDPSTGRVSGENNSDSNFTGRVRRYETSSVNGTTVIDGDMEVIGVSFSYTPEAEDIVIRNDREYKVVSVDPEVIGMEVQFYRLQIRGS